MREKVEKYEFIYDVPPEERENNKRLQNFLRPAQEVKMQILIFIDHWKSSFQNKVQQWRKPAISCERCINRQQSSILWSGQQVILAS